MKPYAKKALAACVAFVMMVPNCLPVLAADMGSQVSATTGFYSSFEETTGFSPNTPEPGRSQNVGGTVSVKMVGDVNYLINKSSIAGSNDFNENESKAKLFDDNPSSKFLSNQNKPSQDNPIWVSFALSSAKKVRALSMVSANDAQERDPKNWTLYGSVDGSTNWTPINTQSGVTFSKRFQQKTFEFENETAYQYYKLSVTGNYGDSGMTQFADVNIATLDPADDIPSLNCMNTVIENGPASTWNQQSNVGWSGKKALTVSGSHQTSNEAYAYNIIYDNLNIPVTDKTKLSYVIFPQYAGNYDFDYTSMFVAVDLKFTDGTYLSDLSAIDQNGNSVSPKEQGESRTLMTRQWNEINSYIGTGNDVVGKTIEKILVGYHKPENLKGEPANFTTYIDDIKIAETEPFVSDHLSDYVNILRGTNDSTTFSRGLTAPAVTMPHGFNFWAPATNSGDNKLYNYQLNGSQNTLKHITVSHEPSYWVGDRGTWQFMINTSIAPGSTNIGASQRAAVFTHENEVAKAHYYGVEFTEGAAAGSKLEVTPTEHAAAARFTFDASAAQRNVILDCERAGGSLVFNADNKSFNAYSDHTSNGMKRMYVYGVFDTEFTNPAVGGGKYGMVSFPAGTTSVTMKVATSFISLEQAKKNLEQEISASETFDDVYAKAQKSWDEKLGIIEIEGASEEEMFTFYSNMYRLFAYPNIYSEKTGAGEKDGWQYKSPYSDAVEDGILYSNNGFWDTYRTTWAAYALLTPEKDTEMLNGLVQHYIDQDWVPRWIAPGGTNSMVGTSSDIIFADALNKGINFDVENAYKSAVKNGAVVTDNATNGGRAGLNNGIFDGYTANTTGEGMSWSMEGYLNDYGIAQMAKELGDTDEYEYYMNRAQSYVNLFSEELGGWFSGKSRSGNWTFGADVYDPTRWGSDYTETNGWNMAFSVVQDGQGLANLYGGRDKLAQKLDEFFTAEGTFQPGGYGGEIHEMKEAREVKLGQYGHSNQPSHHIPYMYNYAGRPDKTQEIVRDVLARCYAGSRFGQGYSGDEDNGEMSAWYIFGALGFYPVSMGNAEYAIGSPLFKKATVHLENGEDLVINAPNNSKENIYVQDVKLNGTAHEKNYFLHSEIANGGVIDFNMGDTASDWGKSVDALPTSITKDDKIPTPIVDLASKTPKNTNVIPVSALIDSVYSAEASSVLKLFDNDSDSSVSFTGNKASLYYAFPVPVTVDIYTVTSGSDKTKAPTSVALYGSNDGENFVELDNRASVSYDWKKYTRPYAIDAEKYQYYRLDVANAADTVEIAEFELLGNSNSVMDKEYLQTIITSAKSLDLTGVSPSLVKQLKAEIASAEAVYANDLATEQEIAGAVNALKLMMERVFAPVRDAYTRIEAEQFDEVNGITIDKDANRSGGANIGGVQHNEWIKFSNVDFGLNGANKLEATYASSSINNEAMPGRIDVILDSLKNEPYTFVKTRQTGSGWQTYVTDSTAIEPPLSGLHDVYFRFISEPGHYVANVDYFEFTEGPARSFGVVAGDIAGIEGTVGTEFKLPLKVTGFPSEGKYQAIEGVLTLPKGVEVVSVADDKNVVATDFDWNVKDGILRFAYLCSDESTLSLVTPDAISDLLNITFRVIEEKVQGETVEIPVTKFAVKSSNEIKDFDLTDASSTVTFVEKETRTATPTELYTGVGTELIPSNMKAVSVAFTALPKESAVQFGSTVFYYNEQRSLKSGQVTYVALISTDVTLEQLSDIDAYTIADTGAQTLMFGDTGIMDGLINAQDALNVVSAWLRKSDASTTDKDLLAMNVSADGKVDTTDAIDIVDFIVLGKAFAVIG